MSVAMWRRPSKPHWTDWSMPSRSTSLIADAGVNTPIATQLVAAAREEGPSRSVYSSARISASERMPVYADVVEIDINDLGATALGIALNRTGSTSEWDL